MISNLATAALTGIIVFFTAGFFSDLAAWHYAMLGGAAAAVAQYAVKAIHCIVRAIQPNDG